MNGALYVLSTATPIVYTPAMSIFSPQNIIIVIVIVVIAIGGAIFVVAKRQAVRLTSSSIAKRQQREIDYPELRPETVLAQYNLNAEQLQLTTSDGLHIFALYVPSKNGAVIILSHGYKMTCSEMIPIAAVLVKHGYGVILPDQRAHGRSEGEQITFGHHEWRDLDAVVNFLEQQKISKIGLFGNSMGGAISIYYTAQDPRISAVIAQSPYASVAHSINKGVSRFSDLPPFPFAPLIHYLAQRRLHINTAEVAPVNVIANIAPRPVMLMMGGQDQTVEASGIFALQYAAGSNCELWYEPELDHVEFHQKLPEQFEQRILSFYEHNLLEQL